MNPKAQRITAAIVNYIGARYVRYADRDRALLAAHKELGEAIDAVFTAPSVTYLEGAISAAYEAGYRPDGFGGNETK